MRNRSEEIVLTPDSARRVAAAVRCVEGMTSGQAPGRTDPRIVHYTKLGITTTSITARSGKTPGSGTFQPYTYNGSTLVLSGPTRTVKNWTGTAVASNKWIDVKVIDGRLFLAGTDCSSVAP